MRARQFVCIGWAVGLALLLSAGCPAPDVPPWDAAPLEGDYDFAELLALTEAAFDLTDVSWGWLEKDILYQRYDRGGRSVYVERIDELNLEFMLWSDAAADVQRLFLPGTSKLEHLQVDLRGDLTLDHELDVWFHEGFHDAADRVRSLIEPRLNPDADLKVVGYSMGGGVAVIIGARLRDAGYNVTQIVTFGQPPVTNDDGAERLSGLPLLRLISGSDPVPNFRIGGYTQFGPALVLLDGPYVVELAADSPDINAVTRQFIDATDQAILDHASYPSRVRAKVRGPVYRVELDDRQVFLSTPPVESAHWLPPAVAP